MSDQEALLEKFGTKKSFFKKIFSKKLFKSFDLSFAQNIKRV